MILFCASVVFIHIYYYLLFITYHLAAFSDIWMTHTHILNKTIMLKTWILLFAPYEKKS